MHTCPRQHNHEKACKRERDGKRCIFSEREIDGGRGVLGWFNRLSAIELKVLAVEVAYACVRTAVGASQVVVLVLWST